MLLTILIGVTVNEVINGNTIESSEKAMDNAESRIESTQKEIEEIKEEWNRIDI